MRKFYVWGEEFTAGEIVFYVVCVLASALPLLLLGLAR